jgi:hypothetical protein
MTSPTYCRYGCGKKIVWVPEHKMPLEVEEEPACVEIEHTFKRCAEVQTEQGRIPYFFDRSKKKK